jgi:hypothetical protein
MLHFNFYFPWISSKKMVDTHIFEAVETLVLVTLQPENDSLRIRILYCVTVMFCCSTMFLLCDRNHNFISERKCQWINEQHCVCVCVGACAQLHSRELNHVNHLKGLVCVTFPLSAQCSIYLPQMHSIFGFPYIQILAKAAILFYSVKTMNSTPQVESNWDVQKWYIA